MSETSNSKSRRRFLADMLFLGGGATAAALLAKSWSGESPKPDASPTPKVTPKKAEPIDHPDGPYPGQMVMPKGESKPPETMPDKIECEEPAVRGLVAPPTKPVTQEPKVEGRMRAPTHRSE